MSEQTGAALRAAREAQNLELGEVAQRLRLMTRQVEAMESGDFVSLGQPVFARGFVRNYARLLGLDADALVAAMRGETEAREVHPAEPEATPEARSSGWLGAPWLLAITGGVLLVVAVPVGLYFWLNSGEHEAPPPRPRVAATPVTPARPVVPALPVPAAPLAPLAEAAPAAALVAEAATPRGIELSFMADAWVEIRDGDGKYVHRQLDRAGSEVVVEGKPPFELVVGNARQVRMSYNGRPIDLVPFIDISVARFTLEE